MNKSKTPIEELPKQSIIKINKSQNIPKKEKKYYEFIDVNLDKSFLNSYFQNLKKK